MSEREVVPKAFRDSFGYLPEDHFDPDKGRPAAFSQLLYDVYEDIIPKNPSGSRQNLTQEGIERRFAGRYYKKANDWPELKKAVSMIVRRLWNADLIIGASSGNRDLEQPPARGTRIRFKEGNLIMSDCYEILADFGEGAHISPDVISAHRTAARFRRGRVTKRDRRFS